MVSMAAYDEYTQELEKLKTVTKELAAKLSEDRWKIEQISRLEQFRTYMEGAPLLDLLLYDVSGTSLLKKNEVLCFLTQYSVRRNRKIRQLLILNGVLEDYISVSDEEQDSVYLYSEEKSKELLGQLIGGIL